MIGKFDGGQRSDAREEGKEGEEWRAINDALEHVTLRNASAAICRHIYYLGDTSIRPLIIILITAARKLLHTCSRSHVTPLLISNRSILLISRRNHFISIIFTQYN